eukprot:745809-Hanusia_phi.AAC.2
MLASNVMYLDFPEGDAKFVDPPWSNHDCRGGREERGRGRVKFKRRGRQAGESRNRVEVREGHAGGDPAKQERSRTERM